MDEKGYQTIVAILDQRATRRLWFTFHVIGFIAVSYMLGYRIQQSVPFLQDGNLLYTIWPLLVIGHFLYICVRDVQGRLLRHSIEEAAKTQVSHYPQKRKHSRLIDEGEGAEDYGTFNGTENIRENKRR